MCANISRTFAALVIVLVLGAPAVAQPRPGMAGVPASPSMPVGGSFTAAPVGRLGTGFVVPGVPFHFGDHFPPRFPVVVVPFPYYPNPYALYSAYAYRQGTPAPNTIVPQIPLTYAAPSTPVPSSLDTVLTLYGIPNVGGRVTWPLGLRLLGGTDELRRQVESLLVQALSAPSGPEAAALGKHLSAAVADLQQHLYQANARGGLTQAASDEAQTFLTRLQDLASRLSAPSSDGYTFRTR